MTKLYKICGYLLGCLLAIGVFVLAFGLSWIITCGAIWCVCWCFGWTFTWPLATGCWIIGLLLVGLFNKNK